MPPPPNDGRREKAKDARLQDCVKAVVDNTCELVESVPGLKVKALDTPTAGELQTEIEDGDYDVLHYVGFGELSRSDVDWIALGLPDKVGLVQAAQFAKTLEGRPSLVMLQLCEREREHVPPDLTEFAPDLLKSGVEAVVAHQYPMSDRVSRPYLKTLYGKLAEGVPVDVAVQSAREKLNSNDSISHAFVSPALFVNRLGGTVIATQRPVPKQGTVGYV
jgi:CHAT domain-containing protein